MCPSVIVGQEELDAFMQMPLQASDLSPAAVSRTRAERGLPPLPDRLPFDLWKHPELKSELARSMLNRLQVDMKYFSERENKGDPPLFLPLHTHADTHRALPLTLPTPRGVCARTHYNSLPSRAPPANQACFTGVRWACACYSHTLTALPTAYPDCPLPATRQGGCRNLSASVMVNSRNASALPRGRRWCCATCAPSASY